MLDQYIINLSIYEKTDAKQVKVREIKLNENNYTIYCALNSELKVEADVDTKSLDSNLLARNTDVNTNNLENKFELHKKICTLSFSEDLMFLKCISDEVPVFVDKKKVKKNQVVYIADKLEFYIEQIKLILSVKSSQEEKELDHEEKSVFLNLKSIIYKQLLDELKLDRLNMFDLNTRGIYSNELVGKIKLTLTKIINEIFLKKSINTKDEEGLKSRLNRVILDDVIGMGAIEPLLKDDSVSEIMVNGVNQIFIEKRGVLSLSDIVFDSESQLLTVIQRMVSRVGRRIDKSSPIVDARLLDGSRINAVIPPISINGPLLTIRKFPKKRIKVQDLINYKSLTEQEAYFLKKVVEARKNIILSGGTSSGKTTLLNVLSSYIPTRERIITIEDSCELQLNQPHVITLECRASNTEGRGSVCIRDLVKNSLRMRPDRIIVGECRGEEAIDMLQAMNTGHDGSMTSVHANSARELLYRLETMVLMGSSLPLYAIRQQISTAVKLIVYQKKLNTGKRVISEICWLNGVNETGTNYITTHLFHRSILGGGVIQDLDAIKRFCESEEILINEDDLKMMDVSNIQEG